MLARLRTLSLDGLAVQEVTVEVDLAPGLPLFDVVGLPDASVRESRERVRASLRNSGFKIPSRRTIVNLAPAHIRKVGPAFDLPIALGVLAAAGHIPINALPEVFFAGELALDGSLRPVRGALCLAAAPALAGAQSPAKLVLPTENASEIACNEQHVLLAADLREVVAWLNGVGKLLRPRKAAQAEQPLIFEHDIAKVVGQETACRALEVAAAGRHNIMFIGPPGVGKTMLARCLPGILPPLTTEESLEVGRIRSIAGVQKANEPLPSIRPFRTPHHASTLKGIMGGGIPVRPGEISLAHNGVIFLDEFAEFRSDVVAALRQPLEELSVYITRNTGAMRFPADVQLLAATNPCPCGWLGSLEKRCRCSDGQLRRYWRRLSGPVLDRIDMIVTMQPVRDAEGLIAPTRTSWSSADMRLHVQDAWQRAAARLGCVPSAAATNSRLAPTEAEVHCELESSAASLLKEAKAGLHLSARSLGRTLRVARTVADLAGYRKINPDHVAEALSYRQHPEGGTWCPPLT